MSVRPGGVYAELESNDKGVVVKISLWTNSNDILLVTFIAFVIYLLNYIKPLLFNCFNEGKILHLCFLMKVCKVKLYDDLTTLN